MHARTQVRSIDDEWTLRQLREGNVWLLPAPSSTTCTSGASSSSPKGSAAAAATCDATPLQGPPRRYLAVMAACFYPIFRRMSVGEPARPPV